ncbi:tetratricopeptide repeat protein [uncultured Bacteroides sp.]|uniref:tetratricopeptide repeat protein n=1 Tax=uncultured Bacteroides sp. TaxID=162156 RepID=UPI002AABD8AA|nr:tetratricopeptide repeat protein [uncultured Bacteroides sp.]
MRKKHVIFILLCLSAFTLSAQTLEEAKELFKSGQYEQAKPVFQKYAKSTPGNPNYSFWYGACCYETGEKDLAEKYLIIGANKKIQESFRYLGQLYSEQYRFEEAQANYNIYLAMLAKNKVPTEKYDNALKQLSLSSQMIKGVEKVVVIDSVVVDKANFLNAYKISEESGNLFTYNKFFKTEGNNEAVVYQTELESKLYYGDKGKNNHLNIYTKTKLLSQWSEATQLPKSINSGEDANYPFVMSDGITLYYSSKGEGSMGGYDIFVTRYNSETDTYLKSDNVGMPFNSPFNDYMYVIDEYNNLGWFASDRYQPKDKVCIYIFIPNESKQIYDYDSTESNKLISLARITSLKDSWNGRTADVKAAKERLETARNHVSKEKEKVEFEFVINDQITYTKPEDFTSPKAVELVRKWQQTLSDYNVQAKKLEKQRELFSTSGKDKQNSLAPGILDLEKRVEQIGKEVKAQEVSIRNEENNFLRK